ncbi:MAG: SAM-dependent methyltransferase [Kiritimatiellia bacterium]
MNEEMTDLLPIELGDEIRTRVFETAGFIRLTQSLTREGNAFRISLRPVRIKGEAFFQAEMTEGGKTHVRNLSESAARKGLDEILHQKGRRELHLVTVEGDLHIRVTKKGKPLIARGRPKGVDAGGTLVEPSAEHDHVKKQPLTSFDAASLLRVIGLSDETGAIKPSMRGKYDQVNALLRCVESVLPETPAESFSIVDCGCGKAYLTLAVHQFLVYAKGYANVNVLGIDRNAGVIASARQMALALGVGDEVAFQECAIDAAVFQPAVDLVMSLHACDTATDDALIAAVRIEAARILCVPCCQHELHHVLSDGGPMRGLLRHGILRERLADLLTDTFRAQVLRLCGYRAKVMEFVSGEATARNILIRAEKGLRPGLGEAQTEYDELKAFWGVEPYIGRALTPITQA